MSAGADKSAGEPRRAPLSQRLPEWLRPRSSEREGRGELRLVETFVLVVVAIVLAVATVHDLSREVGIGKRLDADLVSWKAITDRYHPHATYHNVLLEQDAKTYTTRDIVCANTAEVKPEGLEQICLAFVGPVRDGRRVAEGGYYLVAKGTDIHEPVLNKPEYAYGCFGAAVPEHPCTGTRPPGAPDQPLLGGS